MNHLRPVFGLVLGGCLSALLPGQTLLKDIKLGMFEPSGTNSAPYFLSAANGLYLKGYNAPGSSGFDLIVVDGTPPAVRRLRFANYASLNAASMLELPDGRVVFTALEAAYGNELHVTDGTDAGTSCVVDLWPGSGDGANTVYATLGNRVLFSGNDGTGRSLWISDCTPAGTSKLSDAGPSSSAFATVDGLGRFFFVGSDPVHGAELWSTDGTQAGTQMVADINPSGDSSIADMIALGNLVLFTAYDPATGREVYRSDGTAAGTVRLADFAPGAEWSAPASLTVFGSQCYFTATNGSSANPTGVELYRTDGVSISLVKDVCAGWISSFPRNLTVVGNLLMFYANDGVSGNELWRSDGTAAGTWMVVDATPGLASTDFVNDSFESCGSRLAYSVDTPGAGREPWGSDGTAAGTQMLADLYPGQYGSEPLGFTGWGGRVYFWATTSQSRDLWVTDGTPAGTAPMDVALPRPESSGISTMLRIGDRVVFLADDGVHGQELWVSDGTPAGTVLLADLYPGSGGGVNASRLPVVLGDRIYFLGTTPTADSLWESDGKPVGTREVIALSASGANRVSDLVEWNGALYFRVIPPSLGAPELWRSDGTAAGTAMVASLGGIYYDAYRFVGLDSRALIFTTDVLVTDGTAAGTAQLDPGNGFAAIGLQVVKRQGGTVYFNGTRGGITGLYRSDGTAAGTWLVAMLPRVMDVAEFGGQVLIAVDLPYANQFSPDPFELWINDGTPGGTTVLHDIVATPGSIFDRP